MKRVTSLAMTIALAACSGGTSMPDAQLSGATVSSTHRTAKATLMIHWASTETASELDARLRRRPHFISRSARSIEIYASRENDPSKYTPTIVNKPKTGASSTVSIDAPIGEDAFVFGVYDQANATGNEIGGARVLQTIVAGKANVLKVTLDGYVGGAKLTYNSPFMTSKPDAGGQPNYTLVGAAAVTVTLALTDPDGNTIIPPGTAPVAKLTSTQPSLVKITSSGSNTYTIQAIAPSDAVIGLQVQATSGASGSQEFETEFPVTQEAVIYAAYGAGGNAGVTVFDQVGHAYTSSAFSGLNTPVAMTWDPVDQMILIADAGNGGTLLGFDANGNPAKGWTPPAVPGINGVAYNPDTKAIYVTTGGNTTDIGAVKAFDAKGSPVTLGGGAFAGLNNPIGIAYNSSASDVGGPPNQHQFYIINDPTVANSPSGTLPDPYVAAYTPTGTGAMPPTYSLGTNVPTAIAPTVAPAGANSPMAAYITTTSNTMLFYADFFNAVSGSRSAYYNTIIKGEGLNNPVALVLTSSDYSVNGSPVSFYVANASGGLIAINADQTQNTSVTFPPPTGANNFVALTLTY